jgi:hypothetical protein
VWLETAGLGRPTGNPIAPVIKIASNSQLSERMPDLIDIDTGKIISGHAAVEEVGEEIVDFVIRVAGGERRTKAEVNGQEDFIPWKRGYRCKRSVRFRSSAPAHYPCLKTPESEDRAVVKIRLIDAYDFVTRRAISTLNRSLNQADTWRKVRSLASGGTLSFCFSFAHLGSNRRAGINRSRHVLDACFNMPVIQRGHAKIVVTLGHTRGKVISPMVDRRVCRI